MTAFAIAADLEKRLMLSFSATQKAAVDELLEDASDFLRDLIGQQVTAGTSTFTVQVPAGTGKLVLPQQPARSVESVTVAGQAWSNFQLVNGTLYFDRYSGELDPSRLFPVQGSRYGYVDVEISYTHGIATPPRILKVWTIALASQTFAQIGISGSIGNPGLTSSRLDDWAENYSTDEASQAWHIPDSAAERLQARFGRGAYVVGAGA